MKEFFDSLKNANWKKIGHWIAYPFMILFARFIAGLVGFLFYKWIAFSGSFFLYTRLIEIPEVVSKFTEQALILIGSLWAGVNAAYHLVPDKKYKRDALMVFAGTTIGVELRNIAGYIIADAPLHPIMFIDLIVNMLMIYAMTNSVLKEDSNDNA